MTLDDDDDCIVLDEAPPKAVEAVVVVPREVNMDHANLSQQGSLLKPTRKFCKSANVLNSVEPCRKLISN